MKATTKKATTKTPVGPWVLGIAAVLAGAAESAALQLYSAQRSTRVSAKSSWPRSPSSRYATKPVRTSANSATSRCPRSPSPA
jgi:hypothetical protein